MSAPASCATLRVDDGIAILQLDSPPVNALGHAVRVGIHDGLAAALGDPAARAIVLICAGRTFFAGADITELSGTIHPPLLRDIMALMDQAQKPVVAAMHGTALGGGFELALACHYRVAVPSAKVGLPEAALGLLPGAGGTQRLPRLAGVAAALEMIGLSQTLGAAAAKERGIIDEVVAETGLESGAVAFARVLVARGAKPRLTRELIPDADAGQTAALLAAFRQAHPHLFRGLLAPSCILEAIEAAVNLTFEEGLAREAALSRQLIASPQSAAQRYIFFAERSAAKLAGIDPGAAALGRIAVTGGQADEAAAMCQKVGLDAAVAANPRAVPAACGLIIDTDGGPGLERLAALAEAAPDAVLISLGAGEDVPASVAGAGWAARWAAARLAKPFAAAGLVEIAHPSNAEAKVLAAGLQLARKLGKAVAVFAGGFAVAPLLAEAAAARAALARRGVAPEAINAALRGYGFADEHMLMAPLAGTGSPSLAMGDADICAHLFAPVAAAGAALLQNGTARRASDIDVALVKAGGWPIVTGGPMYWAGQTGLAKVAEILDEQGGACAAPALLLKLARDGKRFEDA